MSLSNAGTLGSSGLLGWGAIVRLGLVQASIGSIVVLATSTMNRVMVVELALPAVFPGILVALHYVVQMARTRFGHGSDVGGRLTSWIIGGMAMLAVGGVSAAGSVALMAAGRTLGMAAAVVSYLVIGLGVGACGTSLLVLLAKSVDSNRRAAAATITWLMMFVGFVVTTAVAGQLLDPYSHVRLVEVTAGVAAVAFATTVAAIWKVERAMDAPGATDRQRATDVAPVTDAPRVADVPRAAHAPRLALGRTVSFGTALRQVWNEPAARRFTLFIFVSMLAYSGQELLFEPFAGFVFRLSPAQTARLSSLQHGGTLVGMLLVAGLGTLPGRWRINSLRGWITGGCAASACALIGLVAAGYAPESWPLHANVFVLGVANGVFAVSAIGSMMSLVSADGPARQGIRMGLWGASQAVAFAVGGAVSSGAVDVARPMLDSPSAAYAAVFIAQAILFLYASMLALGTGTVAVPRPDRRRPAIAPGASLRVQHETIRVQHELKAR